MAKPAIVSVDDDPQVLRSLSRDLRRRYGKDYRMLRAESGAEALEVLSELRDRGDPVALLLSDQRMPKMDGVSFLSEGMKLFPAAKRALLTAYADTEAAISAINRSQVDYYLLKPWDPPEQRLFPVLDDLLEDWRASHRPGYGGVRVVGNRWSPLSFQIKDFLARNHVPYEFLDLETSEEARRLAGDSSASDHQLPLVILPEGERLQAPALSELASHVVQTPTHQPFYDLAIVGGGPAGLAAAVYGASEGLRTVLVEREAPGGQAGTSSRIENYLGFPTGLSGSDLARRAADQARRFKVDMLVPQQVTGLAIEGPYKHLTLSDGSRITSHVLMLSMGVSWRRLPAEGADQLTGRGVYYGAALTEALGCKDEEVYIIGAGNSAGQAALEFAKYAGRVTFVVRGDSLQSKMSQYLVERVDAHPGIEVLLQTEVVRCQGRERLESITLRNRGGGQAREAPARLLFIFIGAAPLTDWLQGVVARDERGFVLTGADLDPAVHLNDWPLNRSPFMLEASVPGIFAAGDVRHGSVKRVASAVGEGSVAVHSMHRFLASL